MRGLAHGRPRRAADVAWALLEGEAVLLEIRNTRSYTLNRVATCMWEACDGQATLEEIRAGVQGRLGISSAAMVEDMNRLISDLSEAGLIIMEDA